MKFIQGLWSRGAIVGIASLVLASSVYAETKIKGGFQKLPNSSTGSEHRNVDVSAELFELVEDYVLQPRTFYETECEYEPGDGKGNWYKYHNIPKSEKPVALSKAIKGIGVPTAEKIVYADKKYFEPKPKHWNAFRDEIKEIERDLNLKGLSTRVLIDFKDENMENLGYKGGQNCRTELVTREVLVLVTVERKIMDLRKIIDVSIRNSKLLSGETEAIIVRYDGKENVSFEINGYNSYSVSNDRGTVYTLNGTGRQAVRPSLDDFSANLSKDSGAINLNVRDARAEELKRLSSDYKINVTLTLMKKKSKCKKDETIASSTETLADGVGSIDLTSIAQRAGKTLENGATYYVKDLSYQRLNTEYFNDRSGSTKSTEITY